MWYCTDCGIKKKTNKGYRCSSCASKLGHESSIETRKKISNALKGHKQSIETRKKISDTLKGNKLSEEVKQKISKSHKGKTLSKETKAKMSKSRKGRVLSREWKTKIAKTMAGKKYAKIKDTKPELEVEQIFIDNKISYQKQFLLENRLYDFYLPDHNILLEVDGTYWHCKPERYPNGPKNSIQEKSIKTDIVKNELAKKFGFKLVRIWEDEINEKWHMV